METTQISIDLDVYKAIQQRLESFTDNPNQVLRKIFGLEATQEKASPPPGQGIHVGGVHLKEGLKLRSRFKGRMLEAEVRNGKIHYDGREYTSPSGAAVAATGTSVNGWRFWQYLDGTSGGWRPLTVLRGR